MEFWDPLDGICRSIFILKQFVKGLSTEYHITFFFIIIIDLFRFFEGDREGDNSKIHVAQELAIGKALTLTRFHKFQYEWINGLPGNIV